MKERGNESRAKYRLLASMGIFGTIGIFVRMIPLPSSAIAFTRSAVGTLFLLLVMRIKKRRLSLQDIRRNLPALCLLGVFLGANWILLFEAYRYTTVATATLCYYLAPTFITIASPFVLHEKLTPVKLACVIAALAGMALVSGVLTAGAGGSRAMTGVLLGLGAAALYAAIVLINKRLVAISAFDTTVMQLGVSAVVLLPYVLLTERATAFAITPRTAALLLIVGVLHTGVAYMLYFGSIRRLPAQTAAIFSYIDPIVAILLSALLLKERMGLAGVAGAVLILGATLFSELWSAGPRGKRISPPGEEPRKQDTNDPKEDCV